MSQARPILTASLGITGAPRGGRPPALIDCGRHGQLSVAQIALLANVSYAAIRARIAAGWKGAQLCQPVGERPFAKRGEIRQPTMLIAYKLARMYHDRVPTIDELRKAHPMSLTAAIKWRRVIRAALNGDRHD